jgi:hypothetical protein
MLLLQVVTHVDWTAKALALRLPRAGGWVFVFTYKWDIQYSMLDLSSDCIKKKNIGKRNAAQQNNGAKTILDRALVVRH